MKKIYLGILNISQRNNNIMVFMSIIVISIMIVIISKVDNTNKIPIITNDTFTKNDKSIYIESLPTDKYQNIVALSFIYEITENWTEFNKIYSTDMINKIEEIKQKRKNGYYTQEYTIHNIITLKEKEYMTQEDTNGEFNIIYQANIKDIVKQYSLTDFSVIHVNYTQKLTEDFQNLQYPGRTYYVNYIIGKSKNDKNLKVYYKGIVYGE